MRTLHIVRLFTCAVRFSGSEFVADSSAFEASSLKEMDKSFRCASVFYKHAIYVDLL